MVLKAYYKGCVVPTDRIEERGAKKKGIFGY